MYEKIAIDSKDNLCIIKLRDTLTKYIFPVVKAGRPIIFLCIGTDRSTGDSLGPLVGDKLKFLERDNVFIYGDLEHPIHAKNLSEKLSELKNIYSNPYIIAIDSCLGALPNIGKIFVENKPLYPGAAMNKDLPPIGDLSITGIVNISGTLEFMVLQNTRLYTVMQLADAISRGIYHSIIKAVGGRRVKISNAKNS